MSQPEPPGAEHRPAPGGPANWQPPPRKSTSPWVWVGLGCTVAILCLVGFVAFVMFAAVTMLRTSDPYRDALARARGDARVIEALGTPIEPGWLASGSINTENRSGDCDLSIPISGPKGSASLHVVGTRDEGRWTYTRMTVTPKKGAPIDLLVPMRGSPSTAPPVS